MLQVMLELDNRYYFDHIVYSQLNPPLVPSSPFHLACRSPACKKAMLSEPHFPPLTRGLFAGSPRVLMAPSAQAVLGRHLRS